MPNAEPQLFDPFQVHFSPTTFEPRPIPERYQTREGAMASATIYAQVKGKDHRAMVWSINPVTGCVRSVWRVSWDEQAACVRVRTVVQENQEKQEKEKGVAR